MQQNSFSVKQQLSLLQKKSDKKVLYTLSKKLQVTYKGQNCRKKLAVELSIWASGRSWSILTIDIDEMLPKPLHRLK